jgi:AAA+ superfamily predicted ATPase
MNGLIIIGATNYSELLDKAVYSRFAHQLNIDAPGTNKCSAILQHLLTQQQFIISIDSPFIGTCIPLLRSDIRQIRATCETLQNALLDTVEKEMHKLGPEADETKVHELITSLRDLTKPVHELPSYVTFVLQSTSAKLNDCNGQLDDNEIEG